MKVLLINILLKFLGNKQVAKILDTTVSYTYEAKKKMEKKKQEMINKVALELLALESIGVPIEEVIEAKKRIEKNVKTKIQEFQQEHEPEPEKRQRKDIQPQTPQTLQPKTTKEIEKVSRNDLFYLRKKFYELSGFSETKMNEQAEYALLKKLLLTESREEIETAMKMYLAGEWKFKSLKHFCSVYPNIKISQEKIDKARKIVEMINRELGTSFKLTTSIIHDAIRVAETYSEEEYSQFLKNVKRKIIDTQGKKIPFTTASIRIDLLLSDVFIQNHLNYIPQAQQAQQDTIKIAKILQRGGRTND